VQYVVCNVQIITLNHITVSLQDLEKHHNVVSLRDPILILLFVLPFQIYQTIWVRSGRI